MPSKTAESSRTNKFGRGFEEGKRFIIIYIFLVDCTFEEVPVCEWEVGEISEGSEFSF